MTKRYLLLLLLIFPLTLSGCFFNKKQEAEPEIKYQTYKSQNLGDFYFSARYIENWSVEETSTGKFEQYNDLVVFNGPKESIKVSILNLKDKDTVLNSYSIDSETQTEINASLATKMYGSTPEGNRFEGVMAVNGNLIIFITTGKVESQNFNSFLNSFSFNKINVTEDTKVRDNNISLKIYFDDGASDEALCEANSFKEVTVIRPKEDFGLIPLAMKLLIQLSVPEELEKDGLLTSIHINTRIRSFGYEDNMAVVNFNDEINQGGGSCLMQMRRSQIEKTLMALNEVSDLKIKAVEIQVEGEADTALQP